YTVQLRRKTSPKDPQIQVRHRGAGTDVRLRCRKLNTTKSPSLTKKTQCQIGYEREMRDYDRPGRSFRACLDVQLSDIDTHDLACNEYLRASTAASSRRNHPRRERVQKLKNA